MTPKSNAESCFHPLIKVGAVQQRLNHLALRQMLRFHPLIKVGAVQQKLHRESTANVVGFHPLIKVGAVQLPNGVDIIVES